MNFLHYTYLNNLVIVDVDKEEYLKIFKNHNDNFLVIFFNKKNNSLYFDDDKIKPNIIFILKNVFLLLTNVNEKIKSSFFITKVIEFLKENKKKFPMIFKEKELHNIKHSLFIVVNKNSETLDCNLLFNYIKLFKKFDFLFYRNDDDDDNNNNNNDDDDNKNNFKNFLFNNHHSSFKKKIDDDNKNTLKITYSSNNKINLYKDTESVIKFIDYLINNNDFNVEKISGLIDYGNLLYNCNLLKNINKTGSTYCCNCDDKIDHLNNFHKIKLKIIEFYILKPSKKISFYFDNFSLCENNYLRLVGNFISDIRNGVLKLECYKVSTFVSSWDLLVDGIDILKNMEDNHILNSLSSSSSSSSLDNKYLLSYCNDENKYILKHPYLPSNLVNNKHIKSRENPFFKFRLKNGNDVYMLYVKFFLTILLKNNISLKSISVDFGKYYSKFNIKDSEDCYNFLIQFIESQNDIKFLSISNGLHYNFKIKDLCHSLYGKKISNINLTFLNFNEEDTDDVCNLIKSSYITNCYCSQSTGLNQAENNKKICDDISKTLKIPIEERLIPIKTITNVKSASKRSRDDYEYDNNNDNLNNNNKKKL